MPYFSVIIPVYNAAHLIDRALRSLEAQTFTDYEVIVCDDGSTDNPGPVLDKFAGVRVISQSNSGPATARNRSAELAQGTWLAFLDADDTWDPAYLEEIRRLNEASPGLDLIAVNGDRTRDNLTRGPLYAQPPESDLADPVAAVLRRNWLYLPAIRTRLFRDLGGFDESLACYEDWELWMRALLQGAQVGYIHERLWHYHNSPNSLSHDRARMRQSELAVFDKALAAAVLRPQDAVVLEQARARAVRSARVNEARDSIWLGRPDARRLSLSVVRAHDERLSVRLAFVAAVLSPALFRMIRRPLALPSPGHTSSGSEPGPSG